MLNEVKSCRAGPKVTNHISDDFSFQQVAKMQKSKKDGKINPYKALNISEN
jgi:hypothetical protein